MAAWTGCVLALAFAATSVPAQKLDGGIEDALRTMTQSAAVIFSGQVVAVRRHGQVVEVDFRVEDAIRGVGGVAYTLREWAGLWDSSNEPLRVGLRYLMLLHGAGRGGLSSPVGGADGAIPIAGGGGLQDPGVDGRVVDLRWIATRIEQTISYGADGSGPADSAPVAVCPETHAVQIDMKPVSESGGQDVGGARYADIIGLLRGWERDAAR